MYVCLLVAALFWLGHLYYIGPGPNFWLIHPLLALTLSLIAELTQSLACTMAVHSCVNAFSDLLRLVRF